MKVSIFRWNVIVSISYEGQKVLEMFAINMFIPACNITDHSLIALLFGRFRHYLHCISHEISFNLVKRVVVIIKITSTTSSSSSDSTKCSCKSQSSKQS